MTITLWGEAQDVRANRMIGSKKQEVFLSIFTSRAMDLAISKSQAPNRKQNQLRWHRPGARPGGKDLLCKKHEAASIPWTGRATKCGMPIAECGMKREAKNSEFHIPNSELGNARSARRILRKPIEASRNRANPADAFCAQAPCPRATTQASRKCQPPGVPQQSRGLA